MKLKLKDYLGSILKIKSRGAWGPHIIQTDRPETSRNNQFKDSEKAKKVLFCNVFYAFSSSLLILYHVKSGQYCINTFFMKQYQYEHKTWGEIVNNIVLHCARTKVPKGLQKTNDLIT